MAASRAPAELSKRAREVRLGQAGRPKNAAAVDAVLDEVAAQDATAAGLRAASSILHDAPAKLDDPSWAGSGTAPWAAWLHHGGIAILADISQRACAAKGGDKDIRQAIEEMYLPPIFNSGGVVRDEMDAQRDRLRRAASACGAKPKG